MKMRITWKCLRNGVHLVSLVRNVYSSSHVSTKSGIVHSVQKKKFDYKQEQCDRISSLQMKK